MYNSPENYQKARKADKKNEKCGLFPAFFNTSKKANGPGIGPKNFRLFSNHTNSVYNEKADFQSS
jgi:hypothetical protein